MEPVSRVHPHRDPLSVYWSRFNTFPESSSIVGSLVRPNVAGYAEAGPNGMVDDEGDRVPVGPVSTELLLQGIGAGNVPKDALVCEVSGTSWKWIGDIAPFSTALDEHQRRRFDPENELTPSTL